MSILALVENVTVLSEHCYVPRDAGFIVIICNEFVSLQLLICCVNCFLNIQSAI